MPRNTSVTLGDHFDRFVSDKVAEGRFHSVSEAVRAGLRKLEDDELKLQALREKLQAGEDSPIVEDFQVNNFINLLHEKNVS
ncbi:type II toxin-antitoxin system ParD family antitoxin [methanotrophic endosymbiont of Bathymodiolus puteoserpentis (Logatchev)]|jgi:antitoxin ParD1/3/4|uniref:type II toxin-antitoxin system ParD family antitoxin n=1 Tax=methanotrophic endosymbiont of Bathymodiolus puteoserpentis (Logatchev) TaxID=343235 RepID=UPI0013CC1E00|nr:ParD protein (antitoxin to ParE) [methanotrophic endosymbiont of Bathymodiolus puteoserpentis (Logatchev)]